MLILFTILSGALSLYSLLCLISIIISWIPGAKFTGFGRFITQITDPYLNLFRRFSWTKIGFIDFSPILSLGILSLVTSIVSSIGSTGVFSLGYSLASIIQIIWSLLTSILGFLLILLVVRYIALLVQGGRTSYDSAWYQLDGFLRNIVNSVSGLFYKNSSNYKNSLLTAILVILAFLVIGYYLTRVLINLCYMIPI